MSRVAEAPPLEGEDVQKIYEWVDELSLSRPKRNITRDFADGMMVAEIIQQYFPRLVDMHNYPQAHSIKQKVSNWDTLNVKIFRKIGFQLAKTDIDKIVNCAPDAVERVLAVIHQHINEFKERGEDPVPQPAHVNKLAQTRTKPVERSPVQNSEALKEREAVIEELRETIEIMESKIAKLEQLIKLKDSKIQLLQNKLDTAGLS